jgi:hypothetical protein
VRPRWPGRPALVAASPPPGDAATAASTYIPPNTGTPLHGDDPCVKEHHMPQLKRIWTGMRTQLVRDAGTDSLTALTIDAAQLTFFDTPQDDQERGRATCTSRT